MESMERPQLSVWMCDLEFDSKVFVGSLVILSTHLKLSLFPINHHLKILRRTRFLLIFVKTMILLFSNQIKVMVLLFLIGLIIQKVL